MEKRKHMRFSAMGPVDVLVQGGTPQEAYLASIGRGGLGIYLEVEVKPTQLVLFNLRLIDEEKVEEEVKVVARVRWSKRAGKLYMAGLSFERMSDSRFARLLKHFNVIETLQLGTPAEPIAAPKPRFIVRK